FGSEMNGLKVEIHCAATGDEKTGIIEFVRSSAADLVILATSGRTELKGIPKATTTERIIRETSCTVLSIKPADFNYDVGGVTRKR
ncbi:MAG: universal stress protein, partial [Planctomycetota bacterium]